MEYLTLLGEIASDRDEQVEKRLQGLARERERLRSLGNRVRDYLEWYRITNSKQLSGDFECFVELKEKLERRPGGHRGPVSEYLDSMQRLFAERVPESGGGRSGVCSRIRQAEFLIEPGNEFVEPLL